MGGVAVSIRAGDALIRQLSLQERSWMPPNLQASGLAKPSRREAVGAAYKVVPSFLSGR